MKSPAALMPAVDEIVTTRAGTLGTHDGQGDAGQVGRPEQGGLDLRPEVLRADLLEEPSLEATGVVDQYVDAPEPIDGGPHRPLSGRRIGDVERHRQEVVALAQGGVDRVGVAAGGDHRVPGGQGRPGNVDAKASAGAGDEPDLL